MINFELLQAQIEAGNIVVQKHPSANLYIYNYNQIVQYKREWNEATLVCRGLILDEKQNIVARPFPKFFNLEEHQAHEIPNDSFEVYEKMDGSLGILYWHEEKPFLATRGSFSSSQGIKGTEILHTKYAHTIEKLDKEKTYLFEIIYPSNRIVIDYGELEDLVLLGIIDKKTGKEEPLQELGFPLVKRYDGVKDIATLKSLQEDNREGFVVKYRNGFRVKVKFAEYVRLHRILTGVSSKVIWELLKNEQSLNSILETVPDEFFDWVKSVVEKLMRDYQQIEDDAKATFKDLGDRKTNAAYYLTQKYPQILFKMLDKKPYNSIIWQLIEPEFEKPFRNTGELDDEE